MQDIDSSTDEIMNALANPRSGRACDRMGMVFGYVQSGKTTHYIGLINKAVDAGYRIVVVLTGIHNSLRSQTQSRIDEEVLGYETSLENLADMIREPNVIGVGIGAHNRVKTIVQSITTRDEKGDVNKTTEGVSMVPPFIIVTKKNATVLRRILRFFRKNQCAEVIDGKKIITAKYPALIIDDEADQASINTNDSYDEKGNLLDDYNRHDCSRFVWPSSNQDYWRPKILRNVERDKKNTEELKALGWNVITVWECELKRAVREENLNLLITKIQQSKS